jgi:glycosyltransferase involved in cell wall biosynthesis
MKLSIITINLNDADGLKKTIESVNSQTFKDFEYIVIDGGSTDNSPAIIKQFETRVNKSVSEKDKGIYNAQNKGIRLAEGEYCLFLNSGDFLADNKVLENFFANAGNADILYGDMMIDNGKERYLGKHPEIITFEFLIHTTLWHPVSFIKRKLFDQFGMYDENLKITADYDFFLRTIMCEKVSTQYVPVTVTVFNTFGIGSSKSFDETHQRERKMIQERYFDPRVIAAAKELSALKRTRSFLFSEFLNKHAFLKKIALFSYNSLNSIRKVTKS